MYVCQDPVRVKQLLEAAHRNHVLPGINCPAISDGERERVASVYNNAFLTCGWDQVSAYRQVAAARLHEACATDHFNAAKTLLNQARAIFIEQHETVSVNGDASNAPLNGHAGTKGAQADHVEQLAIYQPTEPIRSATPVDLLDAAIELLRVEEEALEASDGDTGTLSQVRITGALANIIGCRGFLEDPRPGHGGPHSTLAGQVALIVGQARAIRQELAATQDPLDDENLTQLDDLVRNVVELGRAVAAADLGQRIVLMDKSGNLLDRGACPGQVWPTGNPFQAKNWPDLACAVAALTGGQFDQAYRESKGQGFVLKRARLVVEDLATGEIERTLHGLAAREAVAG